MWQQCIPKKRMPAGGCSPASPLRPPVERLWHHAFQTEHTEGGAMCAWTTDAPIALCEPLHIALTRGATIPWSSHPGEGRCSIHKRGDIAFKSSVFFLKKRKGGIEQKMSYQGKKNIPKITVSKELFLLHWLQELWWLLLQITAEGFSVFLRRCDGSLSHTPMQAQSNMKMLFLLSEPTAGSRWNNAHNDTACLATIVTVRQGDKAFS